MIHKGSNTKKRERDIGVHSPLMKQHPVARRWLHLSISCHSGLIWEPFISRATNRGTNDQFAPFSLCVCVHGHMCMKLEWNQMWWWADIFLSSVLRWWCILPTWKMRQARTEQRRDRACLLCAGWIMFLYKHINLNKFSPTVWPLWSVWGEHRPKLSTVTHINK